MRIFLSSCLLLPAALYADPAASASYSIAAQTTDAGGTRTSSAHYTSDGSTGDAAGLSAANAPDEIIKHGYIGQLYDVTALQLTAVPASVNEGQTRQLAAAQWLDDLTLVPLAPDSVAWSVQSGPLINVSAAGLATAAAVYQHTTATVEGVHDGLSATLDLTVLNILPDNFGTYAGDGVTDDWQVQYFGIGNPLAGPALDPDGDGFDNLFEYRARLIPVNASSFLSMSVTDAPGGGHAVTFSPRYPGTTYTLLGSGDLSLWAPVAGVISDSGTTRTVLDPAGNASRRFYSIQVERP